MASLNPVFSVPDFPPLISAFEWFSIQYKLTNTDWKCVLKGNRYSQFYTRKVVLLSLWFNNLFRVFLFNQYGSVRLCYQGQCQIAIPTWEIAQPNLRHGLTVLRFQKSFPNHSRHFQFLYKTITELQLLAGSKGRYFMCKTEGKTAKLYYQV